jgi:hypothetical protein
MIKTRYQTQPMPSLEGFKPLVVGERVYTSTWHCVKDTFRQDGLVGMYRGMGITMIRAFIGTTLFKIGSLFKVNAVTFYCYEWAMEWLDRR